MRHAPNGPNPLLTAMALSLACLALYAAFDHLFPEQRESDAFGPFE